MATVATFARRRRRANLPPYTPVATALQWIDAAPTLHAFGATANSRAVVVDQRGAVMAGLAPTYSAGNPSAATVNSSTGAVTAVANGTSSITAHSGALTDITQTVTVSQVVASITGVSTTLSTDDASSGTFSPVAKDANGNTVSGASFSYSSAQPSIVSVNASTGAWAGQSAGSTTITITANPGTVQLVVNVTVVHAIGLVISQSPSTVHPGDTGTFTTTYNGSSVTPDDITSSNTAVLQIDPPTVGTLSPTSITQGQSNIAFTLSGCTNLRASDVVSGLPTGVTLSSYTVTGGGTGATFNLTASGTATTGSVNLTISNTGHGTSGTVGLTVNAGGTSPKTRVAASVKYSAGGTTPLSSDPMTVAVGDVLLVCPSCYNGSTGYNSFTISDTQSNSYGTPLITSDNGTRVQKLYMLVVTTAGSLTVSSAVAGAAPYQGLAVVQYRGATASPIDGSPVAAWASGSNVVAPTFATTDAHDRIVGFIRSDGAGPLSTSGLTMVAQISDQVGLADLQETTVQAGVSVSASGTSSAMMGMIVVAIK